MRGVAENRIWSLAIAGLLILEIGFFGVLSPDFVSPQNLLASTENFLPVGFMALSMTLVIITGGIDLSVGSMMSLCGVVMGLLWQHGVNIWLAALLSILLGALLGFINGQLIVRTGIQPLIATLATLFIYGSLAMVLVGQGEGSIYGFPQSYLSLGTGTVLKWIPIQLIFYGVVACLFGFLLKYTSYGRQVYFVGNNEGAALYSGLQVNRVKTITYVLSGCMSGVAAVFMGAYFASVRGDMGTNYELSVITSCLVGGVNVFGGSGTILGAFLGTFLLGVLQQGLNMLNVSSVEQSVVTGAMLIAAVGLQQLSGLFSRRRRVSRQDSSSAVETTTSARD
ncbi:inner-membrane translocator [Alicyclobacillus acidocaldarius subsp. acidocaldarius DSM 446]|uniref:Autoinducer 2 import system permease protein LsrD n=1 Tax=Alicyclobacillus acidocaldarius subsp. acidocaldarius (strain ATCC 27009 / DSM 446 / BCRC 14685 / JCM 5260 / KCTC 1825 / NBRC 15652 / NCIMB 11725 / NRRL B-14509 / 104-IA) TaxID=521098 RepID=C8WTL3_ALIAD|nr:inner-membrane translocator [Alicyclobacillus acidocaldarius subsp. acidocaldarius DSM 446]